MINNQQMNIQFKCFEYTHEDQFRQASYQFISSLDGSWIINRNHLPYLQLQKGYRLLKVLSCGICSTDLHRRFLPFPLPQIIGHQIVATDIQNNYQKYVIQINDTFEARGNTQSDKFCKNNLPTHSPERKILGIDRLPGGFGPYILAPKNAVIPFNQIQDDVAVLVEPFAASLQAIISSPPKNQDQIAVLGPRRLGSLLLAALKAYRLQTGLKYKINAIVRHENLENLAKAVGSDFVINSTKNNISDLKNKFDIVYDTSSTRSGFQTALQISKRELHLKTTNGQIMGGLKHLTQLVVDQLSLLPVDQKQSLNFCWSPEKRENKTIYISEKIYKKYQNLKSKYFIYSGSPEEALTALNSGQLKFDLPRFDLAIVCSPQQIEKCIRPTSLSEQSIIRPRGAILVDVQNAQEWEKCKELRSFFMQGKQIRSSRCGDFHLALRLLKNYPEIGRNLSENLISDVFSSEKLPQAFRKAKQSSSIKVIIKHN